MGIKLIDDSGTEHPVVARTEDEFLALLRTIRAWSGHTGGQIAAFGGLPRSTVYWLVSPRNTSLPRRREQVVAFLRGCRVSDRLFEKVLDIWASLARYPNCDQCDWPSLCETTLEIAKENQALRRENAELRARLSPRSGAPMS
ncbi:hypothetical protein [Nocardia sp. NPDC052566]|uniref:hypothetical protein n=1 Tax=Nocardia sp. NPDC052566 TaxID=3364330 RepID=UPI0037C83669